MPASTILIVGASRGLGLALAEAFAKREWRVIGTVRNSGGEALRALVARHPRRIEIETLDVDVPEQIAALRERLAGRALDILFINAGITTHDPLASIGDVGADEFVRVMLTNAYAPLRIIETLQHLVPAGGVIGAMSSGQGSITNNESGMREVYRASKAALNMLFRSFAARHSASGRAMILLAPGWVQTDLGGAGAPYTIAETAPLLADTLLAQRGTAGLRYLDRFAQPVPW